MPKKNQFDVFSQPVYDAIMKSIAERAIQGDVKAARAYFDEYHIRGIADTARANANIITLAALINSPMPDLTIDDILNGGGDND